MSGVPDMQDQMETSYQPSQPSGLLNSCDCRAMSFVSIGVVARLRDV